MWFNNFFKARTSTSSRRRPTRRPAARLDLEPLEDRRLLSFSPAVNYTVDDGPRAVATADFNRDGRVDLAVAHSNTSAVSVLLGNADGTFQSSLNSTGVGGAAEVAVGDFNADGRPDLAVGQVFSSYVNVLLGNGNGTFAAPVSIDIGEYIGSRLSAVTVGDFNGDGKLDLGVTSHVEYPEDYQLERRANVLLGNGTGAFAAPIVTSLGSGSLYSNPYIAAVAADFNGDGKCDLVAGDFGPTSVAVMLGTGSGALGAPTYYTAGVPIAAGDVSGDGRADLVTASGDQLAVLLGTGLGTFGAPQYSSVGSWPGTAALADFDGDGKTDLVATNVGVLLGNGAGTFRSTQSPALGAGLGIPTVGDFNRDGRPDVASADYFADNVAVFTNDGIWPAPDAPSISISDVTVSEGNLGTTAATFTVSLSAAYGQTVSAHYATADGSALLAAGDYQAASGDVTFAPGVTSQTLTVLVNGDRLVEDNESFLVRLTNATNAFVADATGQGTIVDDETRISVSPDYVTVAEGNTGTTDAVFTVSLSNAYDQEVAVDYDTTDSWAIAGEDYLQTSGTLRFAAGQTSQTIRVPVIGDRVAESEEDFSLMLHNPSSSAALTGSSAVGVIEDDDTEIRISDVSAQEGNTGTTRFTFYVGLSVASAQTVSVNYTTAGGSATPGNDYYSTSGTLTFAPGQTLLAVTVDVIGDRLPEANETFFVNLSSPTNATIADGQGVATILDDEPRISISDVTKAEGKKGKPTLFTFTVSLSAAYDQAVTMSFRTANGTATTSDGDYTAKNGTITFAPGETTKTITIEIIGDSKKEPNEYFYLDLFGNSNNSLFTRSRGTGTILNDD